MAKPGPKPGFKRQPAQQETVAPVVPDDQATAAIADDAPAPLQAEQPPAQPEPSASDRENPSKLSGQALRDLAHRRGIAISTLCFMSDEKIREQLLYINYRQYEDDAMG
jgi:pyruvate/2-oxoglutarate dehydrogenase complex dihydrolipoamide acyltransferase (E2) component